MSTSRPSTRRLNRATPPARPKIPLQFTPFREDHFKTPDGIATVNQTIQQIVNAINEGTVGKLVLPNGADVRGASITGLGDPQGPSDAVSNAHVSTTYGYGAQRAQLDIGGDHALKGLTWAVGKIQQLQSSQQTSYDGTVNYFNISGFLVQFGRATGPVDVVFPIDFPHECKAVVAVEIYPGSGSSHYPNVTDGTVTVHGFHLGISDAATQDAFWIAVGW